MNIDNKVLSTSLEKEVETEIVKSVAAGDKKVKLSILRDKKTID